MSDFIAVRVTPELHDQLKNEAYQQHRTLSNYIRLILTQHLHHNTQLGKSEKTT